MKIFFNASLAGKLKYLEEYKKITSIVENLGHEIEAPHVMKRDFKQVNKQSKKEHERDFQQARSNIKKCDAMIVEGTYPSVGVGYLISLALDAYKPVLILFLTTPHGLLIGDPNRLQTVARYNLKREDDLKKIIESFLKRAKKKILKYKFNLMISETQNQYLKLSSLEAGMSRAEFLRTLIDKKMKSDSRE